MPEGDPVNLTAAIIVAVAGTVWFLIAAIGMLREHRRIRALRTRCVDLSGYDPDLQRYLDRVWLMIETWRPKVNEGVGASLANQWDRAIELSDALMIERAADAESSASVAALVELEREVDEAIDRAIKG